MKLLITRAKRAKKILAFYIKYLWTLNSLDAYQLRARAPGLWTLNSLEAYQIRGLLAGSWTLTLWTTILERIWEVGPHLGGPPPGSHLGEILMS